MARATPAPRPVGNRLLDALPRADLDRLLPELAEIPLPPGEILYQPGQAIRQVYFPRRGMVATQVVLADGGTAEIGLIGSEGMTCLCAVLDAVETPFRTVVDQEGAGWRLAAADFQAAVARSAAFHRVLQRYADVYLTQVSFAAACNSLHTLEQRCCRWLLMTLDRVAPSPFLVTHAHLAEKLGVRRTSVTAVAKGLQDKGVIRYSRGKVTVVDRGGLEACACECYRHIRARLDLLSGAP